MPNNYSNIIFQDDFHSTNNWAISSEYQSTIQISESSLKFCNNSDSTNHIITQSEILPNRDKNYEIEARVKICHDFEDGRPIGIIIGNNRFSSFFKFEFNQYSWVKVSYKKKINIFSSENVTLYYKETDVVLNSNFNQIKIINNSQNNIISFYLNDNIVFNTINKDIDLKRIGFECSSGRAMMINHLTLKI